MKGKGIRKVNSGQKYFYLVVYGYDESKRYHIFKKAYYYCD